jgi:hypothetical protein
MNCKIYIFIKKFTEDVNLKNGNIILLNYYKWRVCPFKLSSGLDYLNDLFPKFNSVTNVAYTKESNILLHYVYMIINTCLKYLEIELI